MSASNFRAGKTGKTIVNNQTLQHLSWSVAYSGVSLPTENFESNGYTEGLIGFLSAKWSLKANWDASKNNLDDPPGLFPRDNGVDMKLYPKFTDGKYFSFPLFRCFNSNIACEASGLVTFDADGENQGTFSVPTGNV